jgi:hypothetical protein
MLSLLVEAWFFSISVVLSKLISIAAWNFSFPGRGWNRHDDRLPRHPASYADVQTAMKIGQAFFRGSYPSALDHRRGVSTPTYRRISG